MSDDTTPDRNDPAGARNGDAASDRTADAASDRTADAAGPDPGDDGGPLAAVLSPIRRFWNADGGVLGLVRDVLSSALTVLLVAGLLFGVSGVWPPMVAVKSGSMNPHMQKGDLVFVAEEQRFAGPGAVEGTGIVTKQAGRETGYSKFGAPGDVIVYRPNNQSGRDPIIHRAMFYVEAGENWYPKANQSYLPDTADSCEDLRYCPAEQAGFITKGDNPDSNEYYDQVTSLSAPVQPSWVEAKALVRIPGLGWVRLKWASLQRSGASVALALVLVGGWQGRRRLPGAS